jgi:hypothetical protein
MADPTAKLFDEEADEEDDDLAPQEDEQVPEEEQNEYVVDGFVVGDDDEGLIPAPKPDGASSSDDEEEDEGRLKRNREEDELADLQLIQDNLQQQEPKKQKRDAVDDLFADDSDEEPAKPVKKKDGLFDEDDFDDFIEDDLGIQQALKREHEASLKGARDGPATDVSQMQLMDMVGSGVPRFCDAFTPSTRLVSRRGGAGRSSCRCRRSRGAIDGVDARHSSHTRTRRWRHIDTNAGRHLRRGEARGHE